MPPTLTAIRELAEKHVEDLRADGSLDALAKVANEAAEIVYLRIGEYLSFEEIAEKLDISVKTVEGRLARARAAGIFSSTDEIAVMMKNKLVPKALNVLSHHLDLNSEESAHATLKGAGVLVSHQRSQQQVESNTTLRVIMETRDGSPIVPLDRATMTGQIVGVGNSDDEAPSIIRQNI